MAMTSSCHGGKKRSIRKTFHGKREKDRLDEKREPLNFLRHYITLGGGLRGRTTTNIWGKKTTSIGGGQEAKHCGVKTGKT